MTSEIVRGDFGPAAINSKFGWLLSGQTKSVINPETTVTNLIIAGFKPRPRSPRWYFEAVLGCRVNWNPGRIGGQAIERWL